MHKKKESSYKKSFFTAGSVLESITGSNRVLSDAVTAETLKNYWPQVAEGELAKYTQVYDYKNKTLYIETSSSVWAQQLMFYKQIVIEKYKKIIPGINIREIKTKSTGAIKKAQSPVTIKRKEELLNPEIQKEILDMAEDISEPVLKEKFKHILEKDKVLKGLDNRRECPICGKRFIGMGEICINCCSEDLHKSDVLIARYLEEAPWSKYQDLLKDHGDKIEERHYHQLKDKIINKLQDRIQTMAYAYYKNRANKLLESTKKEIVKYTMLKTGLTPEKINDNIIRNQVTMRLYKMIYGNIQD